MEKYLTFIATDFATLYREMTRLCLLTPHALNIDAFQTVFDSTHMEYLHYAGSTATQPFHRDVIENLLQLAVVYMSLPTDVSPTSRAFGLYLVFFLYATQPTIETSPVKVRVALSSLECYLNDVECAVAAPEVQHPTTTTTSILHLGCRVTDGERRILLALHRAEAWHVMPFVDMSVHIRTLLRAHEAAGVPLVTSTATARIEQKQINVQKTEDALAHQLEKYEAMKHRLGLHEELGWR